MTIDHLIEDDLGAIVPKGSTPDDWQGSVIDLTEERYTPDQIRGLMAEMNKTLDLDIKAPKKGFAWYCWFCFWFSFGLIVAPFYLIYRWFKR